MEMSKSEIEELKDQAIELLKEGYYRDIAVLDSLTCERKGKWINCEGDLSKGDIWKGTIEYLDEHEYTKIMYVETYPGLIQTKFTTWGDGTQFEMEPIHEGGKIVCGMLAGPLYETDPDSFANLKCIGI